MKTAADTRRLSHTRPAVPMQQPAWADSVPAGWRSEAFAEDLMDAAQAQRMPAGASRPLLRRALAAMLGR